MSEFDRHVAAWQEELERSVSFAGARHDFYTELKCAALLDLVRRRVGPPEELRALDVGCGIGISHDRLGAGFAGLTGVDPSGDAVRWASREHPDVGYLTCSGEDLPFAAGSFDVTFTICVLHHVAPALRGDVVREMARVTAPGGIVAIFEHNPFNPLTRVAVSRCDFDLDIELLPRGESVRLIESAGLAMAESRYVVFFPWRGAMLRHLERLLGGTPFGAQYYVAASVGDGDSTASPSPSTVSSTR